ncbi:DUF1127 domain-containing protein [Bradyrhizobium sp. 162]|jgi:uncharacterized protein YjiS (DUF1127 family)|uniref:DUF1127 domain-containing protein n=2 Tax=Bradyrhizobium TaxID=374 RepID=UPI003207B596
MPAENWAACLGGNYAFRAAAMSTIDRTAGLVQTAVSQRHDSSALKNFWGAFQEWRKWERLRRDLSNLSDRELMDVGIAHGEIDYVASNRDSDPRGIRSGGCATSAEGLGCVKTPGRYAAIE